MPQPRSHFETALSLTPIASASCLCQLFILPQGADERACACLIHVSHLPCRYIVRISARNATDAP